MNRAHVDHRSTRLGFSFIVFAMAPIATIPRVGTLHHPTFLPWSEPCDPVRTRLDLDSPQRTMFTQPWVQRMMVRLVVGTSRVETGHLLRLEQLEQLAQLEEARALDRRNVHKGVAAASFAAESPPPSNSARDCSMASPRMCVSAPMASIIGTGIPPGATCGISPRSTVPSASTTSAVKSFAPCTSAGLPPSEWRTRSVT